MSIRRDPIMHAVRVTPQQIETFRRDGVVVLEGVFLPEEVAEARAGLAATLLRRGVDVMRLEERRGRFGACRQRTARGACSTATFLTGSSR